MTDAETEKKIADIIIGIFDAFQNHAPGGIETHMHPDSTVWDIFTPHLIRGRAERDAFHAADQAQMQARGNLTMKLEPPLVRAWGDTAIALYYLEYEYQPPNPAQGRVRITDVFRRIDGRWLIMHHHEGAVPEGIPPIDQKS